MNLGARLKTERERLGLSQTDFAAVAGASKHAQINWEKGVASPNAVALAAWEQLGLDVLYVVTGRRTAASTVAYGREDLTVRETADWNTQSSVSAGADQPSKATIDVQRFSRIIEMLEKAAHLAGRKWQTQKLASLAVEVYNVLADEPALEEPKVERILKLVVNR